MVLEKRIEINLPQFIGLHWQQDTCIFAYQIDNAGLNISDCDLSNLAPSPPWLFCSSHKA